MYFFVYQTTNLVNGKIYVGVHRTKDMNDGYMGSGKRLFRAIKKYGRENFIREILYLAQCKEEAQSYERFIVNPVFLIRNDIYNLAIGGKNCAPYPRTEEQKIAAREQLKKASARSAFLVKNDPEHRKNKKATFQATLSRMSPEQKNKRKALGGCKGPEANRKRSATMKTKCKGSGNSLHGTVCINNPDKELNSRCKKDDLQKFLDLGWIKGRRMRYGFVKSKYIT